MAFNHIYFNDQTRAGAMLRRMLTASESGDDLLQDIRDMMIQMLSGDGSDPAHFSEHVSRFGFTDNAKAKAAFDEIDTAYLKTSGNGNVSNVRAARDQMYSKFRG